MKHRDAKRVESTKKESKGNWNAYKKKPEHITNSTIDLGKNGSEREAQVSVIQNRVEGEKLRRMKNRT